MFWSLSQLDYIIIFLDMFYFFLQDLAEKKANRIFSDSLEIFSPHAQYLSFFALCRSCTCFVAAETAMAANQNCYDFLSEAF